MKTDQVDSLTVRACSDVLTPVTTPEVLVQKIVFFLLALTLSGCGPESDEVRLWTLGAYFAIVALIFLGSLIYRLITRRHWINPLECLSVGCMLAGFASLFASPFYGYAVGSFGGFMMLFILGFVGLLAGWFLDT